MDRAQRPDVAFPHVYPVGARHAVACPHALIDDTHQDSSLFDQPASRDEIIGAGGISSQPPPFLQSIDLFSEQEPTLSPTPRLVRIGGEVAGVDVHDGDLNEIAELSHL